MIDSDRLKPSTVALYVIVIVAALFVSAALAPLVLSAVPDGGQDGPSVAVLTLRGGTDPANVDAIATDLREIRNNDSVEAAVIRIDSAGGPVQSSEEFYLAVNRTAAEMPVVAYVEGAATSGGYFGIVPSDEIYVKPGSNVGSIGIIIQAPLSAVEEAGRQTESFLRSGPDKGQIDKDELREELETLQSAFVGTVIRHRGDELTLDRQEVARGEAYLGTEAVENGFADGIGSVETAIQRAAELSTEIDGTKYDVVYKDEESIPLDSLIAGGTVEGVDGNVVYVDRSAAETDGTEFVRPVRYYAVWGVPETAVNTTRDTAVVIGDE